MAGTRQARADCARHRSRASKRQSMGCQPREALGAIALLRFAQPSGNAPNGCRLRAGCRSVRATRSWRCSAARSQRVRLRSSKPWPHARRARESRVKLPPTRPGRLEAPRTLSLRRHRSTLSPRPSLPPDRRSRGRFGPPGRTRRSGPTEPALPRSARRCRPRSPVHHRLQSSSCSRLRGSAGQRPMRTRRESRRARPRPPRGTEDSASSRGPRHRPRSDERGRGPAPPPPPQRAG